MYDQHRFDEQTLDNDEQRQWRDWRNPARTDANSSRCCCVTRRKALKYTTVGLLLLLLLCFVIYPLLDFLYLQLFRYLSDIPLQTFEFTYQYDEKEKVVITSSSHAQAYAQFINRRHNSISETQQDDT